MCVCVIERFHQTRSLSSFLYSETPWIAYKKVGVGGEGEEVATDTQILPALKSEIIAMFSSIRYVSTVLALS